MKSLIRGYAEVVKLAGQSVLVADGNLNKEGGYIINPLRYLDQEIDSSESLYVDLIGPASLIQEGTTVRLVPGQMFIIPGGSSVWVTSNTSGHRFTALFQRDYQVQYPPTIVPGQPGSGVGVGGVGKPFPTYSPSGLTKVIPSYLYQEYSDDDDLQEFVEAQNTIQQDYVDTFNAINLPIYTGPIVAGALLDWVGRGLYGMPRPSIGAGLPVQRGPLNTWAPAQLPAINELIQVSVGNVVVTNDDLYRRIITWHFFKGSTKYFSARWLKRRIWRFLYGQDGTNPDYAWSPETGNKPVPADSNDAFIAGTYQISISIGVDRNVTIRFVLGNRTITGGAMLNCFGPNGFGPNLGANTEAPPNGYKVITLNDVESVYSKLPPLPYMSTFKMALESGVLETPYQFNFTCTIG
jgi:hypothetical protein